MRKILAIDDQKDNLRTIVAVVETYIPNCKVITALSGKEGIQLAKKEQPDTILLDIIMPEMDGYEVCERLKSNESTKHIPIIMITAIKTDSGSRVKALNCGADAFLSKPIEEIELCAQIKAMLRIKEAEDKLQLKLNERIKELNCLYSIAKINEIPGITLENIIKKIVNLIPPAWQYPEITCARIIIKNNEYKTDNFLETKWKQSADIIIRKKIAGEITVCYLEEKPKYDEGPFIKEERSLIEVIAERLGKITERKKAELALKRSEEQIRAYTLYFDTKVEEDKKSLAREIHDGLGQLLTALKMELLWIKKKIPEDNDQISKKIVEMTELIDSGVYMIQDLSMQLRPNMLDDLGLIETIKWKLDEFQERTNIKYRVVFEPDEFKVELDRSTSLFRILLEILNNIFRHSGASNVDVSLINKTNEIILKVKDDGKGITDEEINSSFSFGIIGIKERVNIWKGNLQFKGVPGKGTIVTVNIPL